MNQLINHQSINQKINRSSIFLLFLHLRFMHFPFPRSSSLTITFFLLFFFFLPSIAPFFPLTFCLILRTFEVLVSIFICLEVVLHLSRCSSVEGMKNEGNDASSIHSSLILIQSFYSSIYLKY